MLEDDARKKICPTRDWDTLTQHVEGNCIGSDCKHWEVKVGQPEEGKCLKEA
jgi:hypothetical protein